MKKQVIIISCGGTGGHIFPGLEIANAIKKKNPNSYIFFVGALGRMEMQKIPKNGFSIIGLWIQAFYRGSILKNLLFPIKLAISFIQSFFVLIYYRPAAIIGTGGFASFPILFVGSLLRYKTYIQEQNSFPGLANKLLSKYVDKIFVAYDDMDIFFPDKKLFNLGNPVRQSLMSESHVQKLSRSFFKLREDSFTVLIIGGSLGATPINHAISDCIDILLKSHCQLIWQTGELDYNKYLSLNSDHCSLHKFIERMDLAYNAADIVISRAGAIAISEICFLSKASILIPSPYVTDDHQVKNASYLAKNSACVMILQDELKETLLSSIIGLKDINKKESLGNQAHRLFNYNASIEIASIILEDIKDC